MPSFISSHAPDAAALALAIVDTVREPLLVLDKDLRVLAASRSFYLTFEVTQGETEDRLLYELGDRQWDIPGLRTHLETIVPKHDVMDAYEVDRRFPKIGHRTMLLNARKVFYEGNSHTTLLLGIEDITARRALEQEREDLLRKQEALVIEKDVLLKELEHRVGNSLQIIAAIILMKSKLVSSEETRVQLRDAHDRVISIAALQQHLRVSGGGPIEMAPYLSKLCDSVKTSMIGDYRPATLKVTSDGGSVTSREAVSLGLIVTELILNALKHAFPVDSMTDRQIAVRFEVAGSNWKLSVADNGIGAPVGVFAQAKSGLGTSIVNALAQQLDAKVEVLSDAHGTTVSVSHATFAKMAKEISRPESLIDDAVQRGVGN
jgi:two-component sensor histidine kinase